MHTKHFHLFAVPVVVLASHRPFIATAQNVAPTVLITEVSVDVDASTVTIVYDLADEENDACTVSLRASIDGGLHYGVDVQQVTGDVGVGIPSNVNGHTVTWNYETLPDIFLSTIMVVADDGAAPDIQQMVDQVDMPQLMARLVNVATPRHHIANRPGLLAIRDTLATAFATANLEVTMPPVIFMGDTISNVVGRAPGLYDDHRAYVVDAHYDAVSNSPGADDNASGVVATMEIARILGQYRFRNSIRFVGFSFEEQGLVGSGQYVQNDIPEWEQVDGVLNMEMIGYYSDEPNSQTVPNGFDILFPEAIQSIEADEYRGNFLTVVGNTVSDPLIGSYILARDLYVPDLRCIPLSVPGNGQIAPDLRRSDHARFWDAGIKALMLTDGSEYRNANYHTPNDAVATLDAAFMTNVVKATLAATAMLAEPINAGSDTFDLFLLADAQEYGMGTACISKVFPNPASDKIHLELGECFTGTVKVSLIDLHGKDMAAWDLGPIGSRTRYTLPVNGIATGTYVVVIDAGSIKQSHRMDIQRY